MIIQAGFDLQILARPLIVQAGKILPRLVVIRLDSEMQLDGVHVVSDEFTGSLKPHHNAILDGLDPEWIKYFAIAHAGTWTEHCLPWNIPILVEAEELEAVAARRGFRMIGHFGQDETGYMSARAHSYFDQYPSHDDLPCTMTHWVNSKARTCWHC